MAGVNRAVAAGAIIEALPRIRRVNAVSIVAAYRFVDIADGPALRARLHASAEAEYGNYNNRRAEGAINLPIVTDKVLLRIAGSIGRRDGYTKDVGPVFAGKDYDNLHYESFRVGLTLRPTEKLELIRLIQQVQKQFGLSILLVEHSMKVVMGVCQRIAVLDYGVKIAEGNGYDFALLRGVIQTNDEQYERIALKVVDVCGGSVSGKTIAAWGLTFKAHTDDLRDSPSIAILTLLHKMGATIRAYDASARAVEQYPWIERCSSALEACEGADALAVLTEWPEFAQVDPTAVASALRSASVVDGRNVLNIEAWKSAGFEYRGVGRN